MTWWELVPGLLLLAAVVVAPGAVALRLAGVRGVLALGGGPAVSVAVYAASAVVLDRAGVAWAWPPVLVALALALAVGAGLGAWARRASRTPGRRPAGLWDPALHDDVRARGTLVLLGALVVAAALLAWPIARGMVAPDALLQHWDAVYHVSGVQAVRDTGNASSLGAMAPLYGDVSPSVYYPAAWHGIVALAPGFASVAAAANASTFVFGVLVWLLGLAALGRVLGDARRAAVVVVVGAGFGAFPAVILSTLAQWPFGAGIALIPGMLALLVAALRTAPGTVPLTAAGRLVPTVLVLAAAVVGVAAAHASALFSFLLVGVPVLGARGAGAVARRWRSGDRAGRRALVVLVVAGCLAVLAAAAVLLTNPTVRNVLAYERNVDLPFPAGVLRTLVDLPLTWPVVGNVPLALLTVVGAVAVVVEARRRRPGAARSGALGAGDAASAADLAVAGSAADPAVAGPRDARTPSLPGAGAWLVVALGIVLVLTALAAGPPHPLRLLTGFWYTQSSRVAAVYPVVAAPLAAAGVVAAARWLRARVARLAAVPVGAVAAGVVALAVAVTGGWFVGPRTARFEQAYVPGQIVWGTMVSAEEVALLRRLPSTTPPDAVILGDPRNGAAFAYSVAQRRVVFPQLAVQNLTADQRLLRDRFADLDADVCAAVARTGVTHFYLDTATVADGAKVDEDAVGLLRVPDHGVERVDAGGTATLWRVTGC